MLTMRMLLEIMARWRGVFCLMSRTLGSAPRSRRYLVYSSEPSSKRLSKVKEREVEEREGGVGKRETNRSRKQSNVLPFVTAKPREVLPKESSVFTFTPNP